jgi:hypothetical protein
MSRIKEPLSLGAENPAYYAELFCKTSRPADQHDERSGPDVPGIQGFDRPLALQTLLDAVADISLCKRGNVNAMMASLKDDKGTLETRLYIVFNREDEAALRCPQHLQDIFKMLCQVPYKTTAKHSYPKVILNDLENDYIRVCRAIHNYSFDIFAYRVNKHKHKLSVIREYIELDQTHLSLQHRSTLVEFLEQVDEIIKHVANAKTMKQLPAVSIMLLLRIYLYWTEHDLLPKDSQVDEKITFLDRVDAWLAGGA